MATAPDLFHRLGADLERQLGTAGARAAARSWARRRPALAGLDSPREALARCRDREAPELGRAVLSALLLEATGDEIACQAVFAAVLPGLAGAAADLARRWRLPRAELQQAMAAAGWKRVRALAGQAPSWPARAIVGGARDAVRDELRADAKRHQRLAAAPPREPVAAAPGGLFEIADLLHGAVRRGTVASRSARLVFATRVLGVTTTEVARAENRDPKAVVMERLRAERALRAAS